MFPVTFKVRPELAAVKGARCPVPFAAVPHELIADRRLTSTDVRLIGVLLRYCRGKPTCWPSVATLASDLGRCRRTVQLALRRLESAGWLAVLPADNPTGRILVLTWRSGGATAGARGAQPYSQGLPRPGGAPVAPKGSDPKDTRAPLPQDKPPAPVPAPDPTPDRLAAIPADVRAALTEEVARRYPWSRGKPSLTAALVVEISGEMTPSQKNLQRGVDTVATMSYTPGVGMRNGTPKRETGDETMSKAKSVSILGDKIEITWTGSVWVSPSNGQQHARAAAAMRAEVRNYLLDCGEDPTDAEVDGFVSQMCDD